MQRTACLSLDPGMIYSTRCTESLTILPPGALRVTRFISLRDSSGISLVSVMFRAVQSYCAWTALIREFLDFLLELCQLNIADQVLLMSPLVFCCCLFFVYFFSCLKLTGTVNIQGCGVIL